MSSWFVLHCQTDDSQVLLPDDAVIYDDSVKVGDEGKFSYPGCKDLLDGVIKGISDDYDAMKELQDKLNASTKPKRDTSFHEGQDRKAKKKCKEAMSFAPRLASNPMASTTKELSTTGKDAPKSQSGRGKSNVHIKESVQDVHTEEVSTRITETPNQRNLSQTKICLPTQSQALLCPRRVPMAKKVFKNKGNAKPQKLIPDTDLVTNSDTTVSKRAVSAIKSKGKPKSSESVLGRILATCSSPSDSSASEQETYAKEDVHKPRKNAASKKNPERISVSRSLQAVSATNYASKSNGKPKPCESVRDKIVATCSSTSDSSESEHETHTKEDVHKPRKNTVSKENPERVSASSTSNLDQENQGYWDKNDLSSENITDVNDSKSSAESELDEAELKLLQKLAKKRKCADMQDLLALAAKKKPAVKQVKSLLDQIRNQAKKIWTKAFHMKWE